MNQGLLASMGVSHPSLEKVIQLTAAHGLHTKLTGAGGGGVAFSLLTPGIGGDKVGGMSGIVDIDLYLYPCPGRAG